MLFRKLLKNALFPDEFSLLITGSPYLFLYIPVSLLGLINNATKDVIVIIDNDLWKHEMICCHPNVNTATLEIKRDDLKRFFDSCGNEVRIMPL